MEINPKSNIRNPKSFPFSFYQQNFIAFQRQVAVFITKMIGFAVLGLVGAGMVFKIKTFQCHFFAGGFGFSAGVQFFHNAAVAAQNIVYVAHKIITAAVELVIVIIAAHVITEFFICTAMYYFAAIQTVFFGIHKAKVYN